MSYSLDAINIQGAGQGAIIELDSTNAVVAGLTEFTNCLNLGFIKNFQSAFTSNKTESKDETGRARRTEFDFSGAYTGVLMQTDKSLLDFLRETVKGNRYLLYKKHFTRDSGKVSEEFAIVNVSPQGTITTPGADASNAFEATVIYPDSAVTFSSTVLASIETGFGGTGIFSIAATAVSISSSAGYQVVET